MSAMEESAALLQLCDPSMLTPTLQLHAAAVHPTTVHDPALWGKI